MALTEKQIERLPFAGKRYTKRDGAGLYILVTANNTKLWRFEYTRPSDGLRNTISLGRWPEIDLRTAQRMANDARGDVFQGRDPAELKKEAKEARKKRKQERTIDAHRAARGLPRRGTFQAAALDWYETNAGRWKDPDYGPRIIRWFELYIYPHLGNKPLDEITPLSPSPIPYRFLKIAEPYA